MFNASPAPDSAAKSSPVDFEMLCELLIFQGVKLASEFQAYAVDAVHFLLRYTEAEDIEEPLLDATSRLWCWLQRKLRPAEAEVAKVELLPLPQPAHFPMKLQHLDYIADRFDDVKTQLQLIHAVVDELQQKGEETDTKLGRLQEHMRRTPICRCKSQERYAPPIAAPTTKKTPTSKIENQKVGDLMQVNRLEVPMEIMHPPTALQEHSSAMLYWIVKAMSDGSPMSLSELQSPLHAMANESPSTATTAQESLASAHEGQLEQQDRTNDGEAAAMDIAQFYQVLARDDPL